MKKDKFLYMMGLSATLLIGMSGYYSVFGLGALFAGKRLFVSILAGSFEFAKLTITSYLTRYWKTINKKRRLYFIFAIIVLVVISSAGIYCYLFDAYHLTAHRMKVLDVDLSILDEKESILLQEKENINYAQQYIESQIGIKNDMIKNNEDRKLKLQEAMNADSTVSWYNNIFILNQQNTEYRNDIQRFYKQRLNNLNKIKKIDEELKDIWDSGKQVQTSKKVVDVGPLRELAKIFKTDMDIIVKWLCLLIILVFDPLGVFMIVSFNQLLLQRTNQQRRPENNFHEEKEKDITKKTQTENNIKNKLKKKVSRNEDFQEKNMKDKTPLSVPHENEIQVDSENQTKDDIKKMKYKLINITKQNRKIRDAQTVILRINNQNKKLRSKRSVKVSGDIIKRYDDIITFNPNCAVWGPNDKLLATQITI